MVINSFVVLGKFITTHLPTISRTIFVNIIPIAIKFNFLTPVNKWINSLYRHHGLLPLAALASVFALLKIKCAVLQNLLEYRPHMDIINLVMASIIPSASVMMRAHSLVRCSSFRKIALTTIRYRRAMNYSCLLYNFITSSHEFQCSKRTRGVHYIKMVMEFYTECLADRKCPLIIAIRIGHQIHLL